MAAVAARVCPVCLLHVRVARTVYTHLDTAGTLCPMSGQRPVEDYTEHDDAPTRVIGAA